MNMSEVLDQFVAESREGLELIGQRLLDVERDPTDTELINDLFRQVHTLKGNSGLFEFEPLERLAHAGEDVLERMRSGLLTITPAIADALLAAMDYAGELLDHIGAHGRLPDVVDGRVQQLADALRAEAGAAAPAAARPAAVATAAATPAAAEAHAPVPDWALALPAELARPGRVALRYEPEPECFFKGDDPLHTVRQTPGLLHLEVHPLAPWPPAAEFDCYRCNLVLLLVSEAPRAYLEEHYRYVPEQVAWHEFQATPAATSAPMPVAGPVPQDEEAKDEAQALMLRRLGQLWNDQRALLQRSGVAAGTVAAVRQTFMNLLQALPGQQAAQQQLAALPAQADALQAWAQQHQPAGTVFRAAEPALTAAGLPLAAVPGRRAGAPTAAEEAGAGTPRLLKVSQDKIDRLMDLIGEMVVAKNALPYLATRAETVFQQRELAREIKTQYSVINRIAEDMQHAIMQVRLLPVGTIFQRFVRLVRDISKRLGKEVELVIEGGDTEADKNVIECLADPLIHIVRNSLDHGLEKPEARVAAGKPACGLLRVSARQDGDRVLIEITDDGAGIDTDKVRAKAAERGLIPADRADALSEQDAVQLVFLPGFSTAQQISDLSGRGVGMDVVRSAVEAIHGSVSLSSVRGQGTTVRLALPLSMAVTNVMMIESAGRRFGVPMNLIVETVRVHADDIHRFKDAQTVVLRGRIVPLRNLNDMLALDEAPRLNADQEHAVLVLRIGSDTIGLLVDEFHGTSDIILKPLEGVLAGITGFAGTALMGDGSVLMILNPKELL
ncbi:chemotaxis protein CheA [Aquincola tertiaricarbonis]|uniref:histidine kinase n=1 Tax=Aquincola tertiaricarbonis TaxID=391953 RepID=A0ABY4SH28_AQUTE|nr:chemotaxis protein CheA [Aquincola tertiaricarbonis]URI11546.1 chemotaxis protein CheA [Aquincola tertiaricarbonis]